ncbi:MAG: sugar ABC transporter permease [Treponema sp.]|nr:sugar ABC transporter permease [Treponema sp.]
MKNRTAPSKLVMAAYLLPSLIVFLFVVVSPIFAAGYYSTFKWPGGRRMSPVGIQNYLDMFRDSIFWHSFANNIYITVFCLVGQIGFAFLFASLLNTKDLKAKSFHRVVSYFPVTLSAVVVGFVWTMIYDYNYGILNFLLRLAGGEESGHRWLSDPSTIMTVVSIPLIWQYIGMYLVIILAAMTSIPSEVLEMAQIDGAGGFKRAVHIVLPLIRSPLIICVMLCISGNMRVFDHIYAMTRGGPGYASSVMAQYAYNVSFMQVNMGYGSTLSIGILIISMVLVTSSRSLLMWLSRKGAA